jgi:hypothetical protein
MYFYDPKVHHNQNDWFVGHSKDSRDQDPDYLGTPTALRDAIEDFILKKPIEKAKIAFDAIEKLINDVAWIEGDSFEEDIRFLSEAPVFYEVDETQHLSRSQSKTEYGVPIEICNLILQVFRTFKEEDRLNSLRCSYWYTMSFMYSLIDFEFLLGQIACRFNIVCNVNASMSELWKTNYQLHLENRRRVEVS